MLDGHIDHEIADMLSRSHREDDRRPIRNDDQDRSHDAVEIWRAPLQFSFTLGLFMATRVMGVR